MRSVSNFIEKLLEGAEVQWLPLGELAENLDSKRKPITSGLRVPGVIPYYGASGIVDYVEDYIFDGDYLLVSEDGANLIARSTHIAFSISGKTWVNNHAHILKFETYEERCYIEYYLNSIDLTPYISGAAQPKLNKRNLNSIKIPIPCPNNPKKSLKIQAEIVRILDTFTELTAELTARKKQYSYYRDQLLSFEEGDVEWKSLGDKDFFEVASGGTPSKSKLEYWDDGDIPWLKSESCNNKPVYSASNYITQLGLQKSSAKLLQKETTLIALVGATIFKTAFMKLQATTNQNIASIKSKFPKVINDKFVFYYITNLYEVLKSEMRNYGMLNLTTLRRFKIPIPTFEEQNRIVSILDKFDNLTNSISEGLPKEIELRQKQYEYYREMLLTFPKEELTTDEHR